MLTLTIPNIQSAKKINNIPRPKFIQGSVAIKFPIFAYFDCAAASFTPQDRNPTTSPIRTKVPAIPRP